MLPGQAVKLHAQLIPQHDHSVDNHESFLPALGNQAVGDRTIGVINKYGIRHQPSERVGFPVFAALSNEEDFVHEGVVDYSESGVDKETGTMLLRGKFDNSGSLPKFIPGLFVRLRLPIAKRANIPLVSERAIGTDQGGSYLLVLNSEKIVEKRPVRLGRLDDGLRVVEEGVKSGEWVVVNGIQRARPGATVDPKKIDMASLSVSARRKAASGQKQP